MGAALMSQTLPTLIAALLFLSPALPCCAGEPPQSAEAPAKAVSPQQDASKGETPSQALELCVKSLPAEDGADSPAMARLIGVMKTAQVKASKEDPAKKDEVVKRALDEINFAAQAAWDSSDSPEKAKAINDWIAHINNAAGNWEEGNRFSTRALQFDPDDRDALIERSIANWGSRQFPSALADADRAARLNPKDSDAYTARAMASYGLGNYLQSVEDARRALALNPNDRTAFALMKLAEGRSPTVRLDDVRSQMSGVFEREYHGMVQQINQVQERRRNPDEAPASSTASRLVRGAAAKIEMKDYRGAIADASNAIAVDPDNASAYYYRAAAENLLGRYDESAQDATRALVINPSDAPSRDARAWAFNRMDRYRDAIADSNHSLEINPANAYAFANLGYAHERMGDFSSMAKELKAAALLNPQFEPAYQDAVARHGLDAEPLSSSFDSAPPRPSPRRARSQSFLVVLASSLVGGLLIALGILQLLTPHKDKTRLKQVSGIEAGYVIGKTLGLGGMGVVYEAADRALNRKVAIKVMREEYKRDAKSRERFLAEARIVSALRHPNIVAIHSIIEEEAGIYLVFEFVEGRTLEEILRERKRLSLAETKVILRQVCQALEFAHERGVVHRDLKPSNVMVTGERVKVMDFGISRHSAAEGESATKTVQGTPVYMAPEQESGFIRKESDVFSLGVCLYEMTTGRRPYEEPATSRQKMLRQYVKPTQAVPGLPAALDLLIHAALTPDPDLRTGSPREFLETLERIKDPETAAQRV